MIDFPRGTTAEHAFAEHEHQDLARGIDRIHAVARAVGSIAPRFSERRLRRHRQIQAVARKLEPDRELLRREAWFLMPLLEEEAVGVQAITGDGAT